MTTTQPVTGLDRVRTTDAYKVGATITLLGSLLAGLYGDLPEAARRKVAEFRGTLTHGEQPDGPTCTAYGHPAGQCILPAHDRDTAHEIHVDVPRLRSLDVACPTCGPVCTARERVR